MLPNILKENMTALVFDEADRLFLLHSMEGATVGGAITLPSGNKIEAPPEGFVWHIANGQCTTRKKNE